MGPLATLLLATPIFGFSLTIGGLEPAMPAAPPQALGMPTLSAPLLADLAIDPQEVVGGGVAVPQDAAQQEAPPTSDAPPPDATPPVTPPPVVTAPPPASTAAADAEEERYEHDLRTRTDIAKIHRALGISTWISMGVTLLFGGIQYHNLYGDFADISHNPCTTGEGIIFGADQCHGVPWLHVITASVTNVLYFTTFTLSLLMPDPDHADQGNSDFANKMRWHKILRWVHLVGMVAQVVLGLVIANVGDRANDYNTLQALATAHMTTGILTYVALSAAGALMTF